MKRPWRKRSPIIHFDAASMISAQDGSRSCRRGLLGLPVLGQYSRRARRDRAQPAGARLGDPVALA
jgi:hypothetical protein